MSIKNVIICGLGALGLTYATQLVDKCCLKILADEKRINKYKKNIPTFNGKEIKLDYITPDDKFCADLIIIATKNDGLESAIDYIKNFVTEKTLIISLLNGISSEEKISSVYGKNKVIPSFFIGGSAMRKENIVTKVGDSKIVIPSSCTQLIVFFKKNGIAYDTSQNIIYSQWVKLGVNIILNQPSAIYKKTVGELEKFPEYKFLAENLINETEAIAKACGLNTEKYKNDVYSSSALVAKNGKTSMLQDILARRKTEVDIFSGEIIKLGKVYGIKTPYNQEIYNKIKLIEEEF